MMRRRDREITDGEKIRDIISRCICCRVGFYDEGQVYIVPLNFGEEERDGRYTFYFHGASEGRKAGLIRQTPNVGFEMDTYYKLNKGEAACDYSARFQSVIGNGVIAMVEDAEEKKHGLNLIMKHCTGKGEWEYEESMFAEVAVFRLDVTELSCKEHL